MHSSPHPSARLPGNIVATQGPSRFSRLLIARGSWFIYEETRKKQKQTALGVTIRVYSFRLFLLPRPSSCSFSTDSNFSDFFSPRFSAHMSLSRPPSYAPPSLSPREGKVAERNKTFPLLSTAVTARRLRRGHVRTLDARFAVHSGRKKHRETLGRSDELRGARITSNIIRFSVLKALTGFKSRLVPLQAN